MQPPPPRHRVLKGSRSPPRRRRRRRAPSPANTVIHSPCLFIYMLTRLNTNFLTYSFIYTLTHLLRASARQLIHLATSGMTHPQEVAPVMASPAPPPHGLRVSGLIAPGKRGGASGRPRLTFDLCVSRALAPCSFQEAAIAAKAKANTCQHDGRRRRATVRL